jgi:integrase
MRGNHMKSAAPGYPGFFTALRRELKKRRYDAATANEFLQPLKSFSAYFYPCHPRELTDTDIRGYLLYRKRTKPMDNREWSRLSKALQFLYGEIYGRRLNLGSGAHPGSPPDLFVRISSIMNAKHRALLSLVCSAGLRPVEAVSLKPEDIDIEKHHVHVRSTQGKGDRLAPLPAGALEELQFYFKEFHPRGWLFSGQRGNKHLSRSSAQKIVKKVLGPRNLKQPKG